MHDLDFTRDDLPSYKGNQVLREVFAYLGIDHLDTQCRLVAIYEAHIQESD